MLLKLRMLAARLPAYLAAAIPLRYAAAGRCAQDDDAKHDPSPENENAGKFRPKYHEGGHLGPRMSRVEDTLRPEVHLRRNT